MRICKKTSLNYYKGFGLKTYHVLIYIYTKNNKFKNVYLKNVLFKI